MILRSHATEIQLQEDGRPPEWIQLLRTGKWQHPSYGPLVVTLDTLQAFKKNFDERVLGIDINVDYAHNSDKEAACWIRELAIHDDGKLFARVDWTKAGAAKVAEKEYRYTSADFDFDYRDPETGKKFGPVLKGAGLTNRPFVKGMAPTINLSEFTEEKEMNELEKALAQVKTLSEENSALKANQQKLDDALAGKSPEELVAKIQELEAKIAELTGKVSAGEKEKALAEKTGKFDKMLSEGKVVEAQRAAFLADDTVKFAELAVSVKLADQGSGKEPGDVEKDETTDVEEKIHKLAETLVKDGKAKNIAEAQSIVLKDPANSALREEYEAKFN